MGFMDSELKSTELRRPRLWGQLRGLRCWGVGRRGRLLPGLPLVASALAVLGLACAGFPFGNEGSESDFSGTRVLQTIEAWDSVLDAQDNVCPSVVDLLAPPLRAMGALVKTQTAGDVGGRDEAAAALSGAATVAVLEGRSADPILLIAPYTQHCDDSGKGLARVGSAAFLLELGRALSQHPNPYSIWLIFIRETAPGSKSASFEDSPQPTPWREVERLATRFEQAGLLDRVRVAVFFDGLGNPDTAASRDSHSHPVYREVFWESARDLGVTDFFPPEAEFESSHVGHHTLIQQGLRRTVLLTAGAGKHGLDPSQAENKVGRSKAFQSVGDVSLEAINRIQARLARMDQLSGSSREK